MELVYTGQTDTNAITSGREVLKGPLETNASSHILFAFGLNHRTAPVEVREKLYLCDEEVQEFLSILRKTLSECLIISTCNRTEIYAVSPAESVDIDFYKGLLIDFKRARGQVSDEHFFTLISCPATQQLFSVATSIDSRVVGDTQILKQIRSSYTAALENGSSGKVLNQLFQRALKIGKKTFTETCIHAGAVSVSLAAVEAAVETFGSLRGRTAMVIGAGETARLTAEALINKRVGKLVISNRTRAHAEELMASLAEGHEFDGEIVDFPEFKKYLASADIVISSTGSEEPLIRKEDTASLARPILLIDIAVPRDIEAETAENPFVILRNIDDLNSIIDGAYGRRVADLPKVEKLIRQELVDFLMWYYAEPLMPPLARTGSKPDAETTREIKAVKAFLARNMSAIHKIAGQSSGDFKRDLEIHASLVRKLRTMKKAAFEASAGL